MLHDILIIGAGPCGLAVAARLREHTPSAIFTDEEHQRYHWINKHRGKMSLVRGRRGKIRGVGVKDAHTHTHTRTYTDTDTDRDTHLRASTRLSRSGDEGAEHSSSGSSTSTVASGSARMSVSSISSYGDDAAQRVDLELGPEDVKSSRPYLLVLDNTAKSWLGKWHNSFRTLEIEQLRSPMFFHVDPADRDGMLAYATETGRENDLWEIPGCVGKEVSKHKKKKAMKGRGQKAKGAARTGNTGVIGDVEIDERDRKDYFSPGTALFRDFCDRVIERYGLGGKGLIEEGEVVDVVYDYFEGEELDTTDDDQGLTKKVFKVVLKDGRVVFARAVVLAIGPGGRKIIPAPFEGLSREESQGACHSGEIKGFPSVNVKRKIAERKETNVVVVGGGLSSAQIVDMAVRKGVKKVWFLMRSDFKVKHFDITLSWMGKFKNYEKAVFWSADTDEERMEMIKTARGGGSITPRYQKIVREHAARGRVSIHNCTVITGKEYDSVSKTWRLTTDPPIPDLPEIDYIYFATGMAMDVQELPMLQSMHRDYPIQTIQGLPCLTDDLMWQAEVPLFLTGRLAGLRLGPGAANLEGARLGAERIAWAMEEVLGKRAFGREETDESEVDRSRECFCGLGNRYAGLAEA
ncbi:hypothetical protein BJX61DRAFT_536708 [Aspergillus egyptiacus]|nr:hypothetical protein BJX61DRAFT_536708 [Aspergillus egyptiacus]